MKNLNDIRLVIERNGEERLVRLFDMTLEERHKALEGKTVAFLLACIDNLVDNVTTYKH